MKQTLFNLFIITIFSCKSKSEDPQTILLPSKTDTVLAQTKAIEKDTIVYDENHYPNCDSCSTKIITIGQFHEDEVWKEAKKEKWFGLFYNSTETYVDSVKLNIKKEYDPILDEENGKKTGWLIETKHIDTSILFFQTKYISQKRNIKEIVPKKKILFPEDSFCFSYNNVKYVLYAKGGKEKVQDDPIWYNLWNYKLYIKTSIKGKTIETLLCGAPRCDDQVPEIIFIGDLDNDEIPDLILNTSSHYNATCPTLYLSKPANKNEIVKPVGFHESVGC